MVFKIEKINFNTNNLIYGFQEFNCLQKSFQISYGYL